MAQQAIQTDNDGSIDIKKMKILEPLPGRLQRPTGVQELKDEIEKVPLQVQQ